ncbi:hypothetical protein BGX27_000058 [Mortierella sp. AM989]|nr:hypothetical protein BGX27_000058 [Mortierella sp. AM989]
MIHIPHVDYIAVASGAVFIQFFQAILYGPVFGKQWLAAMVKDKNGDQWMTASRRCFMGIKDNKENKENKDKKDKNENKDSNKECQKSELPTLFTGEFILNLIKAWTTGLLLNLTQARTVTQAAQLGAFLFFGAIVPTVTSEYLWEKRGMDLQRFKYMSGFASTVVLACLMHAIGTD